ncbi:Uncharacterized protein ALO43_02862 [Pseudomonas tremae]|uniref:Uncharacterized protein n=1 Tax=Pseudomonas tremae TaxID=200454 RepID=A0AA40P0N3_9PSED|nr:Uncharacterized protein ALO43_02862 [Pseudomonas tremae]RMO09206.1 hypothetical protein ALQ48_01891 [Pseudomonas coronafaciens pv. zizaniae]
MLSAFADHSQLTQNDSGIRYCMRSNVISPCWLCYGQYCSQMRQISAHRPNLLLLVKVSINYLIDADLLAIHAFIAPAMANSGIASFIHA